MISPRLASILVNGPGGRSDEFLRSAKAVHVFVGTRDLQIIATNDFAHPMRLAAAWRCEEPAGLIFEVDKEAVSGEVTLSSDRVRLTTTLVGAEDGSLVAHTVSEFYHGATITDFREHWERYARIAE
ncbi:MAG: hypothetical protein R3D51_00085 [Hyphomicrobiaceae bacterium]